MASRTPLYDRHVAAGARIVDFAGWDMPVQYAGIREEHTAVRERAGIFDVSHMGEIETRGPRCGDLPAADPVERRREARRRRCAVQRAVPRGRRRPRRPLHLPPRARPLPDGHERLEPREGPRLVSPARRAVRRRRRGQAARLGDDRRPGAAGARDRPGRRRRAAARALHRRRPRPQRPPRAGLRNRVHRRGRRRDPLLAARPHRRSGTRPSSAARSPRASARATRCAWRSATTSTATT